MPDIRYRLIPLRRRDGSTVALTIVDAQDFDRLAAFTWHLGTKGYAERMGDGSRPGAVGMHRDILGLVRGDGVIVDHINGDRLDNRSVNLRIGTHALNMQNRQLNRNNTSGYRGVVWAKERRKWSAEAKLDGKRYRLGYFDDVHAAGRAAAEFRAANMPFSADAA